MKKLFFGGIHPADKKELSGGKELVVVDTPDKVIIPMKQHIGNPCEPLVKPGDYVRIGEKIGDDGALCAPVHASVSGVVKEIKEMPHPGGGTCLACVIENDGKNTLCDEFSIHPDPEHISTKELFGLIREAGLVGMGGATFPTEKKAITSLEKIDTLIINACECEPYITADDALMIHDSHSIIKGIHFFMNCLKPEKVVIAVEDNKKKAAQVMAERLKDEKDIEFRVLPTRYPQGAEKQLIKAVTGREVPGGKLPVEVGCAVFNVATMAAVYRAVWGRRPLTRRVVTVTGEGVKNPGNYLVPIGMTFADLIQVAGGLTEDVDKVIAGGPMMGKAQETLNVPVIKGTGAILCLTKEKPVRETSCIRCGKCVDVCPMHLQPLQLYRYEKEESREMLPVYNLMDCIECGCCSYVCPAKLPLVETFRTGKMALKEGK